MTVCLYSWSQFGDRLQEAYDTRPGFYLNEKAVERFECFLHSGVAERGCFCHEPRCAPCSYCTHEDHPIAIVEDDKNWRPMTPKEIAEVEFKKAQQFAAAFKRKVEVEDAPGEFINGIASTQDKKPEWVEGKYVRMTEETARKINAKHLTDYWRADWAWKVYAVKFWKGVYYYHLEDHATDKLRVVNSEDFYVELNPIRIRQALAQANPRRKVDLDT